MRPRTHATMSKMIIRIKSDVTVLSSIALYSFLPSSEPISLKYMMSAQKIAMRLTAKTRANSVLRMSSGMISAAAAQASRRLQRPRPQAAARR